MEHVNFRIAVDDSFQQLDDDAVIRNQTQGFDHEAHESTFGSESQFVKNKERHRQLFRQD